LDVQAPGGVVSGTSASITDESLGTVTYQLDTLVEWHYPGAPSRTWVVFYPQIYNQGAPTSTQISAPPITFGNNGSVVVTVASAAGTPTGNVVLTVDNGAPVPQPLTGGMATFTIPGLSAGDHNLSASYADQGAFLASSAAGTLHVNKAQVTITLGNLLQAYNGMPRVVSATIPGFCGSPQPTVTYDGSATAPRDVGSYAVAASLSNTNCSAAPVKGTLIVFAYAPSGGTFVIGNLSMAGTVTYWGSQWWKLNALSGGTAPAAFKGFADQTTPAPPACGGSWVSGTGNSSAPPQAVPAYMAVVVASSIAKSGSAVAGGVSQIVVVHTDAGYAPNPGHPGTGTIVAQVCPAAH
jgi:hypothetical protein